MATVTRAKGATETDIETGTALVVENRVAKAETETPVATSRRIRATVLVARGTVPAASRSAIGSGAVGTPTPKARHQPQSRTSSTSSTNLAAPLFRGKAHYSSKTKAIPSAESRNRGLAFGTPVE